MADKMREVVPEKGFSSFYDFAVVSVANANSQTQKDYVSAMDILQKAQEKDAKGENADNTYKSAYDKLAELGTYNGAGATVMESYSDRIKAFADAAKYSAARTLLDKASKSSALIYASETYVNDLEDYIYGKILEDANTRYDAKDFNNALDLYKMLDQNDEAIIEKMDGCKFNGVSNSKVGGVVKYGSFEIDTLNANFEDSIEWIVIAKEGNKYLLITRNVIDVRAFNQTATKDVTWGTSTIRTWLNGMFAEGAFSETEFEKINVTKNGDCDDKVFLLSAEEVAKYITEDIAAGMPTDYAIYKDPHMTDDFVCRGWWLRDRTGNYDAAIVDQSGKVVADGYQINDAHVGVRPAIWVTIG
jgi:tetratricopeptide (TPR) repeat protein